VAVERRLELPTLERLGELICGGGEGYEDVPGPYRSWRKIHRFFSDAGVDPPDSEQPYSRKTATSGVLRELNDGPAGTVLPVGIERVLLRLSDIREYPAGLSSYVVPLAFKGKEKIRKDAAGGRSKSGTQ